MTHGLDAPLCAGLHFFDEEEGSHRWLKPIVGIFDVWCLFEVSRADSRRFAAVCQL